MRSQALERMLSSVVSSGHRFGRRRGRNGRKRHVIPAAATLEALEPRVLLSATAFDVVADGNVKDIDIDGVYETVVTNAPSIDHRWTGVAGFGQELGVYEFDLRDLSSGSQFNSAAISFVVNGWTSDTAGNLASADVYAFSGDGTISASDATTPGVLIGTFTILPGGPQQHTLNAEALEAFSGGFVTLRIATALDGHGFNTAAIENTEPAAQLLLDVSTDAIFEVVADAEIRDNELDGIYDVIETSNTSISNRWFDFPGQLTVREMGIYEFDLRGLAPGTQIISAKLAFNVGSLTNSPPDYPIANVVGYSGNGIASIPDATASGVALGSFTVTSLGNQEHVLNAEALESLIGGFAGVRVENAMPNNKFFTMSASEAAAFGIATPRLILDVEAPAPPAPTGRVALDVVWDGVALDGGLDGFFDLITGGDSLTNRYTDNIGEERPILKFDLGSLPTGTQISSAKLVVDVTSYTSSSNGISTFLPQLNLRAFATNGGAATASDGHIAASLIGTGTINDLGLQEFTLNVDGLEALIGGFTGIRIENAEFHGDWFTAAAMESAFFDSAQLILDVIVAPQPDLWTQRGGDAGHTSYVDIAFDPATLGELWNEVVAYPQSATGSWSERAVAIDETHVYRTALEGYGGSGTYHVIAYDLDTGDEVWRRTLLSEAFDGVSEPSVENGIVYVNRAGHSGLSTSTDVDIPRIYGLNALTGATVLQEEYEAQFASNDRPVIANNQLIVEDGYFGGMSAYTASSLDRQWFVYKGSLETPSAAMDDEYAYAFGDEVYRLSDGVRLPDITHPAGLTSIADPMVSQSGKVFFEVSGTIGGVATRGIAAYDGDTHQHLWTTTLPTVPAAKAVGNGVVAVTSLRDLVILNESTGLEQRRWQAPGNLNTEIVLTQTHAFVQSVTGSFQTTTRVHAIDLATGEEDWTYQFSVPSSELSFAEMAMSAEGHLLLSHHLFVRAFAQNAPNRAPVVNDQTMSINENRANGTVVGTVAASGPETDQALTYAILSGDDGTFAINSATGRITVADSTKLDFERLSSHALTVQVTDDHAMPLSDMAVVTINVNDVLENKLPVVSNHFFDLDENSPAGTFVGTFVASDPDPGQTLSYAITGGNHLVYSDRSVDQDPAFAIDSSGNITVADAQQINYELDIDWVLTIRVTDNLGGSRSASAVISINNLNDAPKVSGSGGGLIVENHELGETIHRIPFIEEDAGQALTYSLVGGNEDGVFSINPLTGHLIVVNNDKLDYELNPAGYSIVIRATDSGSPALFTDAVYDLDILNANEAPVVTGGTVSLPEHSANGTPVFAPNVQDEDAGQIQTFAIIGGDPSGAFSINQSTGVITVADSALLDIDRQTSFTLTVQATDNGTLPITNDPFPLSGTAQVVVNLTDVNEAPVVNDQSLGVAENPVNGTVVGNIAATDPDTGQMLTYELTGSSVVGAFAVSATGEVTVANAGFLDFETTPSFTLTVQVADNGTPALSDTAVVTINLSNVNEAPTLTGGAAALAENSAAGTVVATVVGSDADAGTTLTYSITDGNTDGAFAIHPATGQITVANADALDFETTPLFNLGVRVSDGTLSGAAVVTVNITNVNEAPLIADATFNLAENNTGGVVVGTVAATDPDNGQALAYGITDGNTGGAFAINSATGEITIATAAAIDFETNPLFTLTVSATDNGMPVASDTAVVTINLSNVNEAPTLTGGTFNIAENSAPGTAVATVTGTDVDAGTTLTYNIAGGNTGGAFAINTSTGQITVANAGTLNLETTPLFNLHVQVSDGTLTAAAVVTVNITDVNEAPSIADAIFNIAENTANGVAVATVAATDPDNGQALSYGIMAGNTGGAFAINSTTGEITVANAAALDFETTPSFTLNVQATDNDTPSLSDTAVVTIILGNVNEAPVVTGGTVSLPETTANGATVFAVDADDPDEGQMLTFLITAGNDSGAFAIDSTSGVITVANSGLLNNEVTPSYALTVQATDNGTPAALSGSAVVTVNITDVNRAPIVQDQTFTAAENSTNGAVVGTIAGSDPDAGQTIMYAITGAHSGAFEVSPLGEITVADASQLNFETSTGFTLNILATDNGTPVESDTAIITINVANVNEAPSIADVTIDTLAENSGNGTIVTSIGGSDPDGQPLTYAITGGNPGGGGAFAIDPTTGQITVVNAAALDFETNPVFSLTVSATDSGSPRLVDTAVVTINLSNVNEAPTVTGGPFNIAENSADGTFVGTVSGTDPDAGTALTYSIVGGTSGSAGVFAINALTGAITVADPSQLDFETTTSFTLDVRVSDNGSPALTDTTQVIINLTDVNEAPAIDDATVSLAENTADGTAIATVAGSDPDGDTLTYAITDASIDGVFSIDVVSGQITVANSAALDFETNPVFSLTVSATDSGAPGLSDTAVVTISLTNVNEAPAVSGGPFTVVENSAPGTTVGTVLGSDVDAGSTLTFSITEGNTSNAFTIGASTGLITIVNAAALDFEATPSFNLKVQVSDGTLTGSVVVTVNVTNVNEAPSLGDKSATIAENTVGGTLITTVAAADPDSGSSFTYAITDGNIEGAFAIDASGDITVSNPAALDFETNPVFTLTVSAADNGGLSDTAVVTINLANVNEAPTLADVEFDVAENSAAGTIVATLDATDVDGPDLTYFLIGGSGSAAFAFNTDGVIIVTDASQLNFESGVTSFVLDVRVSDGGSPALADNARVTIHITDVNEVPTLSDASFSLPENSDNDTIVGDLTATDPDAGQSHTYAIVDGNTGGAFAINATSGQITVANSAALNFEVNPTFSLIVEVTDSGTPATSAQATVTISLTDIIDEGTPPVIADQSFTVDENIAAGSNVGTVAASPGESGNPVTFEIIGGNELGAFAIHALTGQVTVLDASAFDFETNPSFALTIKVVDSGDPTLFATAAVTVNLANAPEPVMDILRNGQGGDFIRLNHSAPLQVALLSTDDFDATQVDILSLRLGATGTEDSLIRRGKSKPIYHLRDVNHDGLLDLIAHFDTSNTGLSLSDTRAKLTGSLLDGTHISAVQTIVVHSKPGH